MTQVSHALYNLFSFFKKKIAKIKVENKMPLKFTKKKKKKTGIPREVRFEKVKNKRREN